MKLVVFGATGGTGKELVRQALEQGHKVTAFVRNPKKLKIKHKNLSIVIGDARNPRDVSEAVKGKDVVLSALGSRPGSKPICEEGTKNIIDAMKKYKVNRLLVESTFGVGNTKKGFYSSLLWLFIKPFMMDKEKMEELVRATKLEYTIVRPTRLTNRRRTRKYRAGDIRVKDLPSISRADVADFMLREIKNKIFINSSPVVSY